MKLSEIFEAEENDSKKDDKKHKEWDKATDKYHDKQSSGKSEIRMFVKGSTSSKLKALKSKYGVDQIGQVVDKLVGGK